MKIRSPLHSIDGRGRFADALVFSFWRGLNIARKLVIPLNPNTERQATIRGFLTALVGQWDADLTPSQRGTWDAYANDKPRLSNVGTSYKATGRNFFIGINSIRLDLDLPVAETAPVVPVPGSIVATVEPGAAGIITITAPAGSLPAGSRLNVWASPVISDSRKVTKGILRHRVYGDVDALTANLADLIPGARYGVGVRVIDSAGQASQFSLTASLAGSGS